MSWWTLGSRGALEDAEPLPAIARLDALAGHALRLSPLRFFADGWGDRGLISEIRAKIVGYKPRDPSRIHVRWDGLPVVSRGASLRRGWFPSPGRKLDLPAEAVPVRFELLTPLAHAQGVRPPVCLALAATGEEGMASRRRLLGPLLREGIGVLILEHPFYGSRRPRGQKGPFLRSVADLLLSFVCAAEEASSLLFWLHQRGYESLGVCGYSQGGYLASFAAAMTPFAVAAVPCASGDACGDAYARDTLSHLIHWKALRRQLPAGTDAREALLEALEPAQLSRFPRPRAPEAAIIVFPEADGFVRRKEAEALHRHWQGSSLRLLPGGHVSGYLQGAMAMRDAVLDAFQALARVKRQAAIASGQ